MIPDYKLYHGAVLSELVDIATFDIAIGELREEGRLSSYVLDKRVGLHIKHSTARLPPWQFTITKANLADLLNLRVAYRQVFVALVCGTDGITVLSVDEVVALIDTSGSEQAWIRVDRSRRKRYSVSGNGEARASKKSKGMQVVVDSLALN